MGINNDTLCIIVVGAVVGGALYLEPDKGITLAGQVVGMFFAYMKGNHDGKMKV